ncbi:MAG: 2-C-methyl-D-erythritol 4-phosphate cytidylyltransferase [Kiritimatiellae bacterium]|nr:2-C-methyl-D-erythritol 4-phosphate cytidylyltransferase [Kiritimatiellia bacterium]
MTSYGIIVAAGKSERMGPDVDKAFLSLGTKPILAYSLTAFQKCPEIDGVVLVVRKDRLEAARALCEMFGFEKVKEIVAGGAKRQISVMNGLEKVPDEVEIVAVHDGARPCVTPQIVSETVKSAKRYGSGVAAVKVTDTVKYVERGMVVTKTLDRTKLWAVQTPQAFRADILRKAFDLIKKKGLTVTDEASAVELLSEEVRLVPSPVTNIKITTPDDLALATAIMTFSRSLD